MNVDSVLRRFCSERYINSIYSINRKHDTNSLQVIAALIIVSVCR